MCPLMGSGQMNNYGVDLMGRRRRRRHCAEFKAAVIEECLRPGVSMASVPLAHDLNANMPRKWVMAVSSLKCNVEELVEFEV